jgi:type IV pilus assembly protein PilC
MSKASDRALIILFLHLEQMEKAGIPIVKSLAAARDEATHKGLRAALEGIVHEVKGGHSIHEAMGFYPDIFDSTMISLVGVGERSGKMARVFGQCLEYVRRRDEHARLMRKATREPKISAAIIMGLAIFRRQTMLPWAAAAIAAVCFIWWGMRRLSSDFRYMTDRLILALPRLGPLVAQDSWARFAASLAMLFEAGVNMRSGLGIAAASIPNLVIRQAAEEAIPHVVAGQSLHKAFRDTRRMDSLALAMIKAGEDTGNFSHTLRELADFYEKRTADALTALQQFAGPVLTIITGSILYFGL